MKKTLHSPEYGRLAAWLKRQREAQGLTMRELADRIEVPHSLVGKIEQQERRLDIIEFLDYCKGLGVSPIDGLKAVDEKLQ